MLNFRSIDSSLVGHLMKNNTLLSSQRTEIFQSIKATGLNPAEFELTSVHSAYDYEIEVSYLAHVRSGYYFKFDFNEHTGKRRSFYSPAYQDREGSSTSLDWDAQLSLVDRWLAYLKREIESPDPWESITAETQIIEDANSDTTNLPFTEEEKRSIISGMDELRQYLISNQKFATDLVEPKLTYLLESSNRVGRKDWLNLLFATMVALLMAAYAPPETIREVLSYAGQVFHVVIKNQSFLL
jgi:hypothetical protein